MAQGQEPPFPRDWRITGLYVQGAGTFNVEPGDDVSDRDIGRADAIIVVHKNRNTGVEVYRTIHGAQDKKGVGSIIRNTTRVVSPPRKGRTSGAES